MDFIILTGMSGAGKTNALHALEDFGYYCVDNLPLVLIDTFYELCEKSNDSRMKKVAMVVDSRSGNIYYELADKLNRMKYSDKRFKVLFLESNSTSLLKRYKETRRKHPLANSISISSTQEAIELENKIITPVREMSDYIIDTTGLSTSQLRERVQTLFTNSGIENFVVTCMSFGFKFGLPMEADIVFDVRCLPNPYYVSDLKELTGLDKPVRDYVMDSDISYEFVKRIYDFLDFSIPQYKKEGKSSLVIAVGCTGGRHRSVTISRLINSHRIENNVNCSIHHRDIWKA